MGVHGVQSTRNSVTTEFRRHRILSVRKSVDPWTRNSIDTEFRRHGIPPLSRNSLVDTEFPCGHRIPPWIRNPVDTEFCRHRILSTRNSVNTEFHRHGIPSTRNSVSMEFRLHGILHIFFTSVYLVCYAMLFIFVPYMEFHGIRGISQI